MVSIAFNDHRVGFKLGAQTESSRAPSYFSQFFEEQLRQNEDGAGGVRTLYIDRDPVTFQDISRHLQGKLYHGISRVSRYTVY